MRCHLTAARMAIIKKSANNKFWKRYREIGALLHCWGGCKLVQPLWRTVWFLKKLKIELPYGPEILLLGIYIYIKKKTHNLKSYMHPSVHCNTIYNGQDMEAT